MGTLLRSYVEMREPIELSFGVLSDGVGPGTDVLDGGPRASRRRGCFWDSSAFAPPFIRRSVGERKKRKKEKKKRNFC